MILGAKKIDKRLADFIDAASSEIYPLFLHDALPIREHSGSPPYDSKTDPAIIQLSLSANLSTQKMDTIKF